MTRLTLGQKEALLAELRVAGQSAEVRALLESKFNELKTCPHYQGRRASCSERREDLVPVLVARDRLGATAEFLF